MARYAIIENGAVINLAAAESPLEDNWHELPDGVTPQIGDTFDGGIYTRPVEPARLVKWSQVKARRDEVIDGGAPVPGLGTFDSDMLSRINITGAVTLAQIGGQSFSISWTLADNTVVQLNAAQMIGVGAAVGQFVAAAHANAQALRADIEAAQDFAELEAIDIGAGWP